MSNAVMLEHLAIALGLMPEDGNYFEHVSCMMESILSAVICNPSIPGEKLIHYLNFDFVFYLIVFIDT